MQNASPGRRTALALLAVVAVIALLVWGLGWNTLRERREDLVYLGQQHLFLVFWSMLFALLVGIAGGHSQRRDPQPPICPTLGRICDADLQRR